MRIKLFLFTTLFFFVSTLFILPVNANSDNLPIEIKNAIEEGHKTFIEVVSKEYEGYGYKKLNDVEKTEVGPGLEIHLIDYDKLANQDNDKMRDIVYPSGEWQFVITLNGKAMSFMHLVKNNNKYEVDLIGGDAKHYTGVFNRIDNSKAIIDPILVFDAGTYYILYNTPTGKELTMKIPKPIENFNDLPSVESTSTLEQISERYETYQEGERGGSSNLSDSELKPQSNMISSFSLFGVVIILIGMLLLIFRNRRLREK